MPKVRGSRGRIIWESAFGGVVAGWLGALMGVTLLGGQSASAQRAILQEKVVAAEEFRVMDRSGRVVGRLSSQDGGARLVLYDLEGHVRVMAGLDPLGESFLSLHDGSGEFRVILGTWIQGTPQVTLIDGSNTHRAVLSLEEEEPALQLRDKSGKLRMAVKLGKQGDPSLSVMDGEETVRAQLGFSEEDDVLLNFHDRGGEPRMGLGVLSGGEPTLQMGDQEGNLRLSLGSTLLRGEGQTQSTEVSSILLLDPSGRPLWSAP